MNISHAYYVNSSYSTHMRLRKRLNLKQLMLTAWLPVRAVLHGMSGACSGETVSNPQPTTVGKCYAQLKNVAKHVNIN